MEQDENYDILVSIDLWNLNFNEGFRKYIKNFIMEILIPITMYYTIN